MAIIYVVAEASRLNLDNVRCNFSWKWKLLCGVSGCTAALYIVANYIYRFFSARQKILKRRKLARDACQKLKEELQQEALDVQKVEAIVTMNVMELSKKLQEGKLKAVEVLRAFQMKAMEVNDKLNCVTEPIFEAEVVIVKKMFRLEDGSLTRMIGQSFLVILVARAKELDSLDAKERQPLHGIPVSIKESFYLKGFDCTGGLQQLAFKPCEEDAAVIQVLKSLGAVPFVRTNVPQSLLVFACSNPIYGQTLNPHDATRGPGGSSGGEGALIGGGGSVVGLGSDIGGSIRIPCHMCGIYGLKPTVGRLVFTGHYSVGSGQTLVKPAMGPLARDVEGLVLLTRSLLIDKMYDIDPYTAPIPFRDELFIKRTPMRIGFFKTVGGVSPHPAGTRAVEEAKSALEKCGHTVVEFSPPGGFQAVCELYMTSVFGDNGESVGKYLDQDIVDPCCRLPYYIHKCPQFFRSFLGHVIRVWDPALGAMVLGSCELPRKIVEWWRLAEKIEDYKKKFFAAWQKNKLNILIGPGLPFPALTVGSEGKVVGGIAYTALFNLINYPVGYLPTTKVTPQDVARLHDPKMYPVGGAVEKWVKKDSAGSVGLPTGVQCIGLPYQEEVVLRIMQELDTALRK